MLITMLHKHNALEKVSAPKVNADTEIVVRIDPPSEATKRHVHTLATRVAKQNQQTFHTKILRVLKDEGTFGRVQISFIRKDLIVIDCKERQPVARLVHQGKNYLVSSNAVVYKHSSQSNDLPSLKGFINKSAKTNNNKLSISTLETTRLHNALDLLHTLKNSATRTNSINFIDHRGLRIKTAEYAALLGYPPYTTKLSRLNEIIEKNRERPLKIELDFQDKAIVKSISGEYFERL